MKKIGGLNQGDKGLTKVACMYWKKKKIIHIISRPNVEENAKHKDVMLILHTHGPCSRRNGYWRSSRDWVWRYRGPPALAATEGMCQKNMCICRAHKNHLVTDRTIVASLPSKMFEKVQKRLCYAKTPPVYINCTPATSWPARRASQPRSFPIVWCDHNLNTRRHIYYILNKMNSKSILLKYADTRRGSICTEMKLVTPRTCAVCYILICIYIRLSHAGQKHKWVVNPNLYRHQYLTLTTISSLSINRA